MVAKLTTEAAVNTRAQIEFELARVRHAFAVADNAHQRAEVEHGIAREALVLGEEACRKAEEENSRVMDERLALVMELRAIKDDFATFREKAASDRKTMEAEFDSSGDTLFNYGYGCCAFTYNICGTKPHIPDGMPNPSVPLTAEFFANPRCPARTFGCRSCLGPCCCYWEGLFGELPCCSRRGGDSSNGFPD